MEQETKFLYYQPSFIFLDVYLRIYKARNIDFEGTPRAQCYLFI